MVINCLENKKKQSEKERKLQEAMLDIRKRFGKNAVLKGMNLQPTAPTTPQGQGGQAPRPIQPVPGIHKPTDIRSSVEEKSLKIPDFLQRK